MKGISNGVWLVGPIGVRSRFGINPSASPGSSASARLGRGLQGGVPGLQAGVPRLQGGVLGLQGVVPGCRRVFAGKPVQHLGCPVLSCAGLCPQIENASEVLITPLEKFRKEQIGAAKVGCCCHLCPCSEQSPELCGRGRDPARCRDADGTIQLLGKCLSVPSSPTTK